VLAHAPVIVTEWFLNTLSLPGGTHGEQAAPGKCEGKRRGALEHCNDGMAVSFSGSSASNFTSSAHTPYLYDTLRGALGHHATWFALRHRQTVAWMMVGLRCAKAVSRGAWAPSVVGRA